MSQIVNVLLHSPDDDNDILSFCIGEDSTIDVNLNDENCQNQLKEVFLALFALQIEEDVALNLTIEEGYKRILYKDVCEEYINDLNRELSDVRRTILEELSPHD